MLWCLLNQSVAQAKDWELMLVPHQHEANLSIDQLKQLEAGVVSAINSNLDNVVDLSQAIKDCRKMWCGYAGMQDLMQQILAKTPQVELVVIYSISAAQASNELNINVSLIDPLSLNIRFSDTLRASVNKSMFDVGVMLGGLIESQLRVDHNSNRYLVNLSGFADAELDGLSTHILSNAANKQLRLLKSAQSYLLYGKYFPLTNTQYNVSSSLSASQLKQMLLRYFKAQNLSVEFEFDVNTQALSVKRSGNPYAPSVLTWLSIFLLMLVLAAIFIRRQVLQQRLHEYSKKHNADKWLETYHKAAFPLYRLHRKWRSRASYWERLQRDSLQHYEQAKMYVDAGELVTAKLLLSKALHTNSANSAAKDLVQHIKGVEGDVQNLSETEQWLRNKIAKAMNNYKQLESSKALRQLYQAFDKANEEKGFKKQAKAIKKLIRNILNNSAISTQSIVINCSADAISTVMLNNETLHLGRLPSKTDIPWISSRDAVFYINHKQVSRIGQHCFISKREQGFVLIDSVSKNGTYVNGELCDKNVPVVLRNGDRIQLGSQHNVNSATFVVSLNDASNVMQLTFLPPSENLVERSELNRIWPDNALALRTQLSYVQNEGVLLFNAVTQRMQICERADLAKLLKKRKRSITPVCLINLGEKSSLSPFPSKLAQEHGFDLSNMQLQVDDVLLLGEVPLELPCTLSVNSLTFTLTDYRNASVRHSHSELQNVTS